MSRQNVYDNDAFFDHFRDCRNNEVNFNDCIHGIDIICRIDSD